MKWDSKDEFLEKVYRKGKSINSVRYYKFGIEDFKRFCDKEGIKVVNQKNVYSVLDNYVGSLDKKGLKPKSIKDSVSAIRKFLAYNDIEIDSAKFKAKVTMPRVTTIADEPLTIEEVRTILSKGRPTPKMRALILTLLSSGMRIGEALKIRWKDANLDSTPGIISLKAEVTKTRVARIAYVSDEANEALKEISEGRAADDLVFEFAGDEWQRQKEAGYTFRKIVARAGLGEKIEGHRIHKIHFHSFLKFVLTKGVDLLGEHAGHSLIGHGAYMDVYYLKSELERRADYLRLMPSLQVFKAQTEDSSVSALRTMVESGVLDLNKDSVKNFLAEKLGLELPTKKAPPEPPGTVSTGLFVGHQVDYELLREQIYDALGIPERYRQESQSDPQMVVQESQLESYLSQGWQYVSTLGSGRIIIRHD